MFWYENFDFKNIKFVIFDFLKNVYVVCLILKKCRWLMFVSFKNCFCGNCYYGFEEYWDKGGMF